jgi:hypothetical protein
MEESPDATVDIRGNLATAVPLPYLVSKEKESIGLLVDATPAVHPLLLFTAPSSRPTRTRS